MMENIETIRNGFPNGKWNVPPSGAMPQRRTWRFLTGLAERAGGTLAICEKEGKQCFEFIVIAVDINNNLR